MRICQMPPQLPDKQIAELVDSILAGEDKRDELYAGMMRRIHVWFRPHGAEMFSIMYQIMDKVLAGTKNGQGFLPRMRASLKNRYINYIRDNRSIKLAEDDEGKILEIHDHGCYPLGRAVALEELIDFLKLDKQGEYVVRMLDSGIKIAELAKLLTLRGCSRATSYNIINRTLDTCREMLCR